MHPLTPWALKQALRSTPVPQWTHRRFSANNPWEGDKPAEWNVVVCRMRSDATYSVGRGKLAQQTIPATSNDVPPKLAVGIEARTVIHTPLDRKIRILPNALQDLWRAGRVWDEDLPWLLNRLEKQLRKRDFPTSTYTSIVRYMLLTMAAMAVVIFALMAMFGEPSEIPEKLRPVVDLVMCAAVVLPSIGYRAFLRRRRGRLTEQCLAMLQERPASKSVSA